MARLTLDLPPDLHGRLREMARRSGKPIEVVAIELLARSPAASAPIARGEDGRAPVLAALREAGLLSELNPEERHRAARSSASLDDVRAALDRTGGPPLSELILEMRGPKA